MKTPTSIALAALLLSGVTAAAAATASSHSAMAPGPSDTLSLSTTQQKTAWNAISGTASNQTAPSGFNADEGAMVPGTVKIAPVPRQAANAVPALRRYDFAMVQGKLLIVNPADKKVVEVITG